MNRDEKDIFENCDEENTSEKSTQSENEKEATKRFSVVKKTEASHEANIPDEGDSLDAFEDEDELSFKKLREIRKKNKIYTSGGGSYIALALCIMAVICFATYGAVRNVFDIGTPLPQTKNTPVFPSPNTDEMPSTQVISPDTDEDIPVIAPSTTEKDPLPMTKDDSDQKGEEQIPSAKDNEDSELTEKTNSETDNTVPVVGENTERIKYIAPVSGKVIKDFSGDVLVYSVTMNDYRVHTGVDIACNVGEAVKCFSDGIIVNIEETPLMGNTITVDHGDGLISHYSNLSYVFPNGIEVGTEVSMGDIIGGVGESALIECGEEPHLHFEVIKNGAEVDPISFYEDTE